mmetsp:Transcript_104473/g.261923  ORF Transcript_104473/g.261923 Transcript_104473/m.261923 type:complete len:399 (+) Transcript_104473:77-1273(+)
MRLICSWIAAVAVGFGATAATVAVEVKDVPIYCRLLQVGLETAQFQPVLEDLNLSAVAEVAALGSVDVSASHLEIGAARLVSCGASVDESGRFSVGISKLDVDLKQLEWQYAQRRFPHAADQGVASANTSISFNVSIDMVMEEHEIFGFKLGQIDLKLGAQHHSWLSTALEKLTKFMRPLLSAVVEHAARKALRESLAIVRKQGGCAFLQGSIADMDFVKLAFTSYEPMETHVPLLGNVNISVNSTYIKPPTSMHCEHVGFNGSLLTARVENVPFSAGFEWAYHRLGSSYWHNQGTGIADVVAGTLLYIDLLKPSATRIQVELPTLKLELQATADAWMYHTLTHVMVPLVRDSLQLFGGKLLTHYVSKCLANPKCPHLRGDRLSAGEPIPQSSSMLLV